MIYAFVQSDQNTRMNRLVSVSEQTWLLADHAHLIVHETNDGHAFVTIYDCGATQNPPSAQLIATAIRIDAEHEHVSQPTGYIAKLREPSVLERHDRDWIVRPTDDSNRRNSS